MAQAKPTFPPWSDWQPIYLSGVPWRQGVTNGLVNDIIALDINALNALADATVNGYDFLVPTIGVGDYGTANMIFHYVQIPIPDFIFDRQPARLRAWDGLEGGDGMDPAGAGRRPCLLIEYNLSARIGDVPGPDLANLVGSARFRGAGAQLVVETAGVDALTDTQDSCITSDTDPDTAAHTPVFGNMSFPAGTVLLDPPDQTANAAFTFGENGAGRVQWLIEIPASCAAGDWVDWRMGVLPDPANLTSIQYQNAKYKWIVDEFPFAPNQGRQLDGTDADGYQLLEEQSRLDGGDSDASPYKP